jgi:hypothetical protein
MALIKDFVWLILVLITLFAILFARMAYADSKICYWQVCEVVDGKLGVCPIRSQGSEKDLEKADRESRRANLILNRECVEPNQETGLSWKGSGIFFNRK